MCPPGRQPGSGQQAFFLGLSPPSSCPLILSLPSEKAEKDHAVGRLDLCSLQATTEGWAGVPLGQSMLSGAAGKHVTL